MPVYSDRNVPGMRTHSLEELEERPVSPALVLVSDPEVSETALRLRTGLDGKSLLLIDYFGDTRRLEILAHAYWRVVETGHGGFLAQRLVDGSVDRRTLLRKGVFEKVLLPSVDPGRCVASRGCRLCVDVCPSNAIVVEAGSARITADCTLCGRCLAECPVGAIRHRFFGENSVNILLSEVGRRTRDGVILAAARDAYGELRGRLRGLVEENPWLIPLRLMSADQLTLTHMLYALGLGFTLVAVSNYHGLKERARVANIIARSMGLPQRALVVNLDDLTSLKPQEGVRVVSPDYVPGEGLAGLRDVLSMLDAGSLEIETTLPLGMVVQGSGVCTLCNACVGSCPTEALVITRGVEGLKLRFSHSLCIGCGRCVERCPENAISLRQVLRPGDFAKGVENILFEDREAVCARCGKPLGVSVVFTRTLYKRLVEKGVPPGLAERVFLCEDCKRGF